MNNQNFSEKINRFIDFYDHAIKTQNYRQMFELIPLIDSIEEQFLNGYQNRKKDGAFYTDKTIADFIVKETLLSLINKKLKISSQNTNKKEDFDDIFNLDEKLKRKIIQILLDITICDPACGSGIFLLSSANIIYESLLKLNYNLSNNQIKERILNNLFGYEINNLSIKLCVLKCLKWYSPDYLPEIKRIVPILISNLKLQNIIFSAIHPKVDIIIGNPPYGNILNQKEKETLKRENSFYKEIYCLFLKKALEWSNELIGFLVPKSFLLRQGYIKFRNDLLSRANFLKIFDVGSKVFKNATNEVQIILYEKRKDSITKDLTIYDYPKNEIIVYPNQAVDSLRICFNLACPLNVIAKKIYVYSYLINCPFCGSETISINRIRIKSNKLIYNLLEKIEKIGNLNYLNPIDFPNMIRGEEEKGLRLVKKKLRDDTDGSCIFISARNDFNYYYFNKTKSFNIEEINASNLKGAKYEYYKSPKLLIKHNNIIPQTLYTEDNICFTSSIYSLLHNEKDELKFLCALINSSLIQFYCTYAINNQKDTTINLNQYMIRHLPIKKPTNEIINKIIEIVDQVDLLLKKFKGKPNIKVFELLRALDQIIFQLYTITEQEANLIISKIRSQIKFFNRIYES